MKGQLSECDPRFRRAWMFRKLAQKISERLSGLLVPLRGLGEAFLKRKIAARLLVSAALAQLLYVRDKPDIIVLLKPRERSIEERIAGELRRRLRDRFE